MPGGRTGLPSYWGNKYRNQAFQVEGGLKIQRVTYDHESRGTYTLRQTALMRPSSKPHLQTHSLVGEGAPYQKSACV
jgi:hypothetical protein